MSKWTGGELGSTGASDEGLSPSKPASDWPPPSDNNGFDSGDKPYGTQPNVDGPTGKATPNDPASKVRLT